MITSTANPLVKRIRALRRKKARAGEGVFLAEGIAVTIEALDSSAQLERLLVAPGLLTSEPGQAAVARARAGGIRVTEVSDEVFASFSNRDEPVGLAALAISTLVSLEDMRQHADSCVVALQECADPGNLGTILRTADASGCGGVIVCGPSADPLSPEAVRASMGTIFRVPVARAPSLAEATKHARRNGLSVIATSAKAPASIWDTRLPKGGLYVFGNEQRGLSAEERSSADLEVSLPMHGAASSLNLAVAVGIVLYEIDRRRTS